MRVLSDADSELYAKLVRLAGGDTGIVMNALSKPGRRSIQLGVLVDEIVAARKAKQAQSVPLPN